jgi:hypothetical protein
MGIAQDLGLVNSNGHLDTVTCSITQTAKYAANFNTLHAAHAKASTAYLHSRVDVINNTLCASAEGLIFGVADTDDERLLRALALNGPTPCMAELFIDNQGTYGGRLHFRPDILG